MFNIYRHRYSSPPDPTPEKNARLASLYHSHTFLNNMVRDAKCPAKACYIETCFKRIFYVISNNVKPQCPRNVYRLSRIRNTVQ